MSTLLLLFPRLDYLTVTIYNVGHDMADGFAWARLLPGVKHFEFQFEFSYNAFEQQQPLNLDSFRTKSWLEKKKWFVTYQRNLKERSSILYSNSSSTIKYQLHEIIGILVTESTELEPRAFPHVHH